MSKKQRDSQENWLKPENAPKARAWMKEVVSDAKWTTTTKEAEGFLQYLMDCIIKQMQDEENELAKKENREPEEIPPVNVQLSSHRVGKRFIPLVAIFDTTCLKNRSRRRNSKELDIFNPETRSRGARLKAPIYKYVVKPFMYTQKDMNAFFQRDAARALGLEPGQASMLKQYREPKIQKFNKGHDEYVTLMIDPIRLFSAMAAQTKMVRGDKDANQKFETIIYTDSVERIHSGNWKYVCTTKNIRNKNKKNKKYEDQIYNEMERRMRGR